jgi:hypothetical protein
MFTICFTTLLVGTWAAITVFEFYRANRREHEKVRARGRRVKLSGPPNE